MTILSKLQPKPSRFKKPFQQHGIPTARIAPFLGLSYQHSLNLINGVSKMSPEVERKLQALLDELEVAASEANRTTPEGVA